MCMLPSRPRVRPPTAHVLGEERRAVTPRMKKTAMSRWEGKSTSPARRAERAAHRNGFLAAAHVDAAQDFALPVQFALDAVFDLAHQRHVIEDTAAQVRLDRRAGELGSVTAAVIASAPPHADCLR